MDFKALSPFIDPVLGQNMELGLCVYIENGSERNTSVGASSFFSSLLSPLFTLRGGLSNCDPKEGQGVELGL